MEKFVFGKIEDNFWKFSSLNFESLKLKSNNFENKITDVRRNADLRDRKGQGLVEYMVLVALITAGTIGVIRVVSYNIGIQYENINRALGAKAPNQLQAVSAEQSILNKKDLSNFLNGVK